MVNDLKALPLASHLFDLKKALLQILAIVGLVAILAFTYVEPIVEFITAPITTLDREIHFKRWENPTSNPREIVLPKDTEILHIEKGQHLEHSLLLNPGGYAEVKIVSPLRLLLFSPAEGLMVSFKLAIWLALFATLPFSIIPVVNFLRPALYPHEKKLLIPFALLSFLFIGIGLLLGFYISIPLANQYFLNFNSSLGENFWGLANYLDYTLNLLAAHAIGFELMLTLLFLVHLNFLTSQMLAKKRRYAIVLAFIIGAILTPPDVLSQFLLAIPLIGFYELAILYGKFQHPNHKPPAR